MEKTKNMEEYITAEIAGFNCVIVKWDGKSGMSHRCGYVEIPENHPFYNHDSIDCEIECHGGITYDEMIEGKFWIGFDTNHLMDKCNPKSLEYCQKEVESIVSQLNENWETEIITDKEYYLYIFGNKSFIVDKEYGDYEELDGDYIISSLRYFIKERNEFHQERVKLIFAETFEISVDQLMENFPDNVG